MYNFLKFNSNSTRVRALAEISPPPHYVMRSRTSCNPTGVSIIILGSVTREEVYTGKTHVGKKYGLPVHTSSIFSFFYPKKHTSTHTYANLCTLMYIYSTYEHICMFTKYTVKYKYTPVSYTHLDVYKRQRLHLNRTHTGRAVLRRTKQIGAARPVLTQLRAPTKAIQIVSVHQRKLFVRDRSIWTVFLIY